MEIKTLVKTVHSSWRSWLNTELSKPYIQTLEIYLNDRYKAGATIFPAYENWFKALALTPLNEVKVVIIGQDPYHQPGQAQGLSFSVPSTVKIPPSLRNIFIALAKDTGFKSPSSGCLECWAKQGVLLLNSVLTVESDKPNVHQNKGWERLTEGLISLVSEQCPTVVFMLWGKGAQQISDHIDIERHLMLKAPHPSPLSAYRGFFECQHFSKANSWLQQQGVQPIQWQLPMDSIR